VKLKKAELIVLIQQAIERQSNFADGMEGDDNPQVNKVRLVHLARAEAYSDVLRALQGDAVSLKISAGK
jgi:hypothetical protein